MSDLRLPLLLGLVALVLSLALQTYTQLQQRLSLTEAIAEQDRQLANAGQIQRQLDALAGGTSALAAKGNTHAQQILSELAKQGISVSSPTK